MLAKRIIPCLDVRHGRVVKGVQFEGLRDTGDPVALATRYVEEGADELVLLDVVATQEARAAFADVVGKVARALSIPFTVGGGIGSIETARALITAGADNAAVWSAVGGVPTEAAIEFITRHESHERGWYTGPVGWFDAAGDGRFVVALRSGLVAGKRAELYAGAGVVQDSNAPSELAETRWKLAALLGALGVSE